MNESFDSLSVIELRKIAKEKGIKLGAGINKQGIIDKLKAAQEAEEPTAAPVQLSLEEPAPAPHHARSAVLITDEEPDEEDVPVLTAQRPSRPAPRPQAPVNPPAAPQPASTLSSISSKAPAFTLEGSQAWHNPRAYQGQSSYQHSAAPSGWSRPAQSADQRGYARAPLSPRQDNRLQPQRPVPQPVFHNRFGPDQGAQEPEQKPADYHQPANAVPSAPRDYTAPQPEYVSPRENAPAPVGYVHPAGSLYRKDPAAPPAQALAEILAAGECGDGEGVLELLPDGYGFLRAVNYQPGKQDVYISNAQIRRFSLRTGDYIAGKTRPQRDADRYSAMLYITDINGAPAEEDQKRPRFDELTPIYPKKRVNLSGKRENDPLLRAADLLSPIGFGQRLLLRVQPGVDGMAMLRRLSASIGRHHLKASQMLLSVGDRPEEITDIKESFKGEVVYSTFDDAPETQVKTVELALERAMRLAEMKKDVIVLLNGVDRLAWAGSAAVPQSARSLPCGLAVSALSKLKKIFGAARCFREGGSLTLIAAVEDRPGNGTDAALLAELQSACNAQWVLGPGNGEDALPLREGYTLHAQDLLTEQEQAAAARLRADAQNDFAKAAAILQNAETGVDFPEQPEE